MGDEMHMCFGFDDPSQSFVNGFEAGMVWQEMREGRRVIERSIREGFPVHNDNLELFKRMAAAGLYELEIQPTNTEGWTAIRFTRSDGGKPKPKLAVVP